MKIIYLILTICFTCTDFTLRKHLSRYAAGAEIGVKRNKNYAFERSICKKDQRPPLQKCGEKCGNSFQTNTENMTFFQYYRKCGDVWRKSSQNRYFFANETIKHYRLICVEAIIGYSAFYCQYGFHLYRRPEKYKSVPELSIYRVPSPHDQIMHYKELASWKMKNTSLPVWVNSQNRWIRGLNGYGWFPGYQRGIPPTPMNWYVTWFRPVWKRSMRDYVCVFIDAGYTSICTRDIRIIDLTYPNLVKINNTYNLKTYHGNWEIGIHNYTFNQIKSVHMRDKAKLMIQMRKELINETCVELYFQDLVYSKWIHDLSGKYTCNEWFYHNDEHLEYCARLAYQEFRERELRSDKKLKEMIESSCKWYKYVVNDKKIDSRFYKVVKRNIFDAQRNLNFRL